MICTIQMLNFGSPGSDHVDPGHLMDPQGLDPGHFIFVSFIDSCYN